MNGQQQIIFEQISEERRRQDTKNPLPLGFPRDSGMRLAILVEEVGEVGKALCEEKKVEMRKELIEVAAVALRWLEMIDDDAIAEMRNMERAGISPTEEEIELYRSAIRRRTL